MVAFMGHADSAAVFTYRVPPCRHPTSAILSSDCSGPGPGHRNHCKLTVAASYATFGALAAAYHFGLESFHAAYVTHLVFPAPAPALTPNAHSAINTLFDGSDSRPLRLHLRASGLASTAHTAKPYQSTITTTTLTVTIQRRAECAPPRSTGDSHPAVPPAERARTSLRLRF
ncbi:hypothetical protein AB1N83_012991 [Pleurotus pulmonarius]